MSFISFPYTGFRRFSLLRIQKHQDPESQIESIFKLIKENEK